MSTPVTRNVLVMEFNDGLGKLRTIRVSNPKPDLTTETVEAAMDVINSLNAFETISQYGPASKKKKKTVQTVTNNFDIVVN